MSHTSGVENLTINMKKTTLREDSMLLSQRKLLHSPLYLLLSLLCNKNEVSIFQKLRVDILVPTNHL